MLSKYIQHRNNLINILVLTKNNDNIFTFVKTGVCASNYRDILGHQLDLTYYCFSTQ